MLVAGIDENGLGPLLGPLVVTGVCIEIPGEEYAPDALWRLSTPDAPVQDSKKLFSPGRMKRSEAAVLPWLEIAAGGLKTQRHLHEKILINHPVDSEACPEEGKRLCSAGRETLPLWIEPGSDLHDSVGINTRRAQSVLDKNGSVIRALLSVLVCPKVFNDSVARYGKMFLDFRYFIEIARALRKRVEQDVLFICGKIGSTKRYADWFSFMGIDAGIIHESTSESAYAAAGLGEFRFIRDADDAHFCVALASMAGKYLRELAMLRLNGRMKKWIDSDCAWISGYANARTRDMIEKTANARRSLGLPDECFIRIR